MTRFGARGGNLISGALPLNTDGINATMLDIAWGLEFASGDPFGETPTPWGWVML